MDKEQNELLWKTLSTLSGLDKGVFSVTQMATKIEDKIKLCEQSQSFIKENNRLNEENHELKRQILNSYYNSIAEIKSFETILSYVKSGATHRQKEFYVNQMLSVLAEKRNSIETKLLDNHKTLIKDASDFPF